MEKYRLHLTDEDLKKLPVMFRYLKVTEIPEAMEQQERKKFVAIDFYQTRKFETYPHYKPISKIVGW